MNLWQKCGGVEDGRTRSPFVTMHSVTRTQFLLRGNLACGYSGMEEDYTDTSEEDKRQALETLMEYGRGTVSDAQEGHKELWNITAKYLFKGKAEDPKLSL
jgi:hypothetical protein